MNSVAALSLKRIRLEHGNPIGAAFALIPWGEDGLVHWPTG
ncbi:hypothetical protein V1283_003057 [Bradyrhizobium sp. AZCC 2262]